MSPELGALAHTQSPLPLPAQDWFLAMDSCSLVPWAPPSLPPCQPFPKTRSHKQVKTVESEAQLIDQDLLVIKHYFLRHFYVL